MRSRGMFVVWVGICVAILAIGSAPASAQPADALKKAQSAFDAAQVKYLQGLYDDAAAGFEGLRD